MTDISEWVRVDDTGVARCWWPGDTADYVSYHDNEWGRDFEVRDPDGNRIRVGTPPSGA